MKPEKRKLLAEISDKIGLWLNAGISAKHIVAELKSRFGASYGFQGGTYALRVAGLRVTCTAGEHGAIDALRRKITLELMKDNLTCN